MAWPNFSVTTAYATLISGINTAFQTVGKLFKDQTTGDYVDQIRYNSSTKKLEYWTGSAWSVLDMSGTAASTAATLATARTIGGVSFNGSANINLPGVNQAGNQDTSGNAATATKLATPRTIGGALFDGSSNIDILWAEGASYVSDEAIVSGAVLGGTWLGYKSTAGCIVEQLTSKSTAVAPAKPTGRILTHNASLAANTTVSFSVITPLSNEYAIPVVALHDAAGALANNYQVWVSGVNNAMGYFTISVRNISTSAKSEQIAINFAVIRGGNGAI